MKFMYVADDGTPFNSEKECIDYENKYKNTDTWEPCIFKPCTGEPYSHQCLDGFYNKSRHLFKLDPLFSVDKVHLLYTWKEDDVLEFTMKEAHVNELLD